MAHFPRPPAPGGRIVQDGPASASGKA